MMRVVMKPKLKARIASRLSKALGSKKKRVKARTPAYHALKGRANGLKKFIEEDERNQGMNDYPSTDEVDEQMTISLSQLPFCKEGGVMIDGSVEA